MQKFYVIQNKYVGQTTPPLVSLISYKLPVSICTYLPSIFYTNDVYTLLYVDIVLYVSIQKNSLLTYFMSDYFSNNCHHSHTCLKLWQCLWQKCSNLKWYAVSGV